MNPPIKPSKLWVRIEKLKFAILFFSATGMLYGNIVFGRLGTYPLSLPFIFTILFYLLSVPSWFKRGPKLKISFCFFALLLVLYQFIIHGWILEGVSDSEWIRSFSLLVLYAGLLIISWPLELAKQYLPTAARTIVWTLVIMGGLGIIQFLSANTIGLQIQLIPESLALRSLDLAQDSQRFGGIIRAVGFAYEPSFYGTGMVVSLVLYLVFLDWFSEVLDVTRFHRLALVCGFGGVIVSFSLAAWGVLGVVLILRQILRARPREIMRGVVVFLILSLIILPLWSSLSTRWTVGNDYSLIHRIWSSIELIVDPGEDLISSLLGTGIGLENNSYKVRQIFIQNLGIDVVQHFETEGISLDIVNGISYISVSSGWIGLLITVALIFSVFSFSLRVIRANIYIVALLFGYFFTNARYLWPEWWFLLLAITIMYNVRFASSLFDSEIGQNQSTLEENPYRALSVYSM